MSANKIRILISSPSDVLDERLRVERAAERVAARIEGLTIECYRWERSELGTDNQNFRNEPRMAGDYDLLIGILWSRLGVSLPDSFPRMHDGEAYHSGTEFEILSALELRRRGVEGPDVLIYRKTPAPLTQNLSIDDRHQALEQLEAVDNFFDHRLRNEADYLNVSIRAFDTADRFELQVERDVWNWLVARQQRRAIAPPQRPATIEVEFGDDGRLHRLPSRPPVARDDAQEHRLRSAWAAHSDQLSALESLDPGRNSPGLGRALADYRHALGPAYEALNVIALGVHGTRIEGHAARADERLMEDAAGELVALAASHALFIRQFAAWREYLHDAADEPSDAMVAAAVEVARSAPAHAELIAGDVSEPLVALAEIARPPLTADPEDRPTAIVRSELLHSVGNVLSGALGWLVDYARKAGTAARDGNLDGIKEVSKQATIALAFGGSSYALALAAGMPADFGWLVPVLAFLKMKFKP